MNWPPPLPIWTEAEAIDYAEGCAWRWRAAMARPHPLPRHVWEALDPPDRLRVPGRFWSLVRAVFRAQCGIDADAAVLQWWTWGTSWYGQPQTWIEAIEHELRDYDQWLREGDEDEE